MQAKQSPSAPLEIELEIESLAYEGAAVARDGARVVFVEGAAPGDRVRAVVTRERKRFAEARVVSVLRPGAARVSPPCPVAGRCGGCDWQHVDYAAQLAAKRTIVVDALERGAKVASPAVESVVASPDIYGYRNRIRLHWSDGRLAYYERGSHRPVAISDCPIAELRIRAVLSRATALLASLETPIGDVELAGRVDLPGVTLALRSSGRFAAADTPRLLRALGEEGSDGITGVAMSGPRWSRTWGDTRRRFVVSGRELVVETVESGFGQVNTAANRRLVEVVLEIVAARGTETVWDLYSGAGNLALVLARAVKEIVAVERDPAAVAAARTAADRYELANARFFIDAVEHFLAEPRARPDVVVANPPRTGLEHCATRLAEVAAPRVIYVSCNPPTLARDVTAFMEQGYSIGRVRPVDLFPQTCRVETVCELVLT
jgi:23S rRNA (uracil1939-C5)-methyltransferase